MDSNDVLKMQSIMISIKSVDSEYLFRDLRDPFAWIAQRICGFVLLHKVEEKSNHQEYNCNEDQEYGVFAASPNSLHSCELLE